GRGAYERVPFMHRSNEQVLDRPDDARLGERVRDTAEAVGVVPERSPGPCQRPDCRVGPVESAEAGDRVGVVCPDMPGPVRVAADLPDLRSKQLEIRGAVGNAVVAALPPCRCVGLEELASGGLAADDVAGALAVGLGDIVDPAAKSAGHHTASTLPWPTSASMRLHAAAAAASQLHLRLVSCAMRRALARS